MMDNFPRFEPEIMDSTAVMTFKTCPRKYLYSMVFGFKPFHTPPYFAFGSAYHLFRELIEKDFMVSNNAFDINSLTKAISAVSDYCDKHLVHTGAYPKFEFMTKDRAIKSAMKGYEFWQAEKKAGTIKVLAVEQPFRILIPSKVVPNGIIIAGRADQVIEAHRRIWGRDFKTTSQTGPFYVNSLEPNDQFTRYTYAESILQFGEIKDSPRERVQGQYIEVLINSKTIGPEIKVYPTSRTKEQLETWLEEHDIWMEYLMISREKDNWPMNEKSCNFCEYRRVCTLPTESMQMTELKKNFRVEPWNCENIGGVKDE